MSKQELYRNILKSMGLDEVTKEYTEAIKITSDAIINPSLYAEKDKVCVIPLETGGGKSSITNMSLVWLAKNDYDNSGTIILKERTEDCDKVVEQINEAFGRQIAVKYYAKMFELDGEYRPKREHLHRALMFKYPILVMTHEGFKNRRKKLGDFVYWTSDPVSVGMHNAGKSNMRTRLIIDEQPNPFSLFQITNKSLVDVENFVQSEGSKVLFAPLSRICQYIRESCFMRPADGAHQYWDKCGCKIPMELENYFYTKRKQDDIFDIYTALKIFCTDGGIVNYSDDSQYKSISAGKYIDIFDPLFSTVILDGTARINSVYSNKRFHIVDIPKIKTYKNTSLHICKQFSGSRSELSSSPEIINATLNYITNKVPSDEKCLIVTLKMMRSEFENLKLPNNIAIDHFGNITGTNKYRDFKYLFIIGTPFLTDGMYKMAFHTYHNNQDKTKSQGSKTRSGVRELEDPDYDATRKSMLAVEIVQVSLSA